MTASTNSARVFLVDDHPIVRMGFGRLLEASTNLSVCGEAGGGEEALEKMPDTRPDLAVVDISMDGMDGLELTRRLAEEHPDVRVLIVSIHDEVRYVKEALGAGACGYVLKDHASDLMSEASRAILAGQVYICKDMREKL